jgi:hypothetical protein
MGVQGASAHRAGRSGVESPGRSCGQRRSATLPGMSDLEQKLDEIYDKLVDECSDPRATQYREEFRAAQAEARERFDRWRGETLDERRRYHGLRGLDKKDADAQAQHDVRLLSIDPREELDRLIVWHWTRFTQRLASLLEGLKDEEG